MEIDRREKNWRQLRLFLMSKNTQWLAECGVPGVKAIEKAVDMTDYNMETIVVHTKRLRGEEIPLSDAEISRRLNHRNQVRISKG